MTFTKTDDAGNGPGFFAAEAAGLRWLAEGGLPVVAVHEVGSGHITLERLVHAAPSKDAARQFGAALARCHASGAPGFGAPPAGHDGGLYIGTQAMPAGPGSDPGSWGSFYAATRVLPFVPRAVRLGMLTAAAARIVEAACAEIAAGTFDDGAAPARIHGDLWSGNVMWTPRGAVAIDPAAHGGHAETDLAMLALFGCPQLDEILRGYEAVAPLRGGWRERIPLHQLHPLAVHAAGQGAHYGEALERAARQVLALCR
ncbi:fructosamine kinase family protein [Hoyosella sp. G463]|uniref:Fructosamine kinase family protein n=1 Tax=Lolliginicoccus lacisalsi TaxID=2742202 RepID=A0A927JE62_9ACTN|nr:fructosamine kinase family protein [Lolliginicoccus lacisalsi]MBD8507641.1 fructosamine kinase family protein [Lolliginicoccus lacisalsi]